MRVLYILNTSILHGGATKSFLILLKGLMIKGIDPYVILPNKGELCDELKRLGVDFEIIAYNNHIYPPLSLCRSEFLFDLIKYIPRIGKTLMLNIYAVNKLKKHIKKIKPRLIHTNAGGVNIGHCAAKDLKIPHVWHQREYQTLDFGSHPIPSLNKFRKKLDDANNICIGISKDLFNYLHLCEKKDYIVYNGIASQNVIRFTEQKSNYFLFVGRLQECKGIEVLINTYKELFFKLGKDKIPYLLIAGDTDQAEYKEKLNKLVSDNDLSGVVKFLGNRNDVFDLMYSAKALIVPSFSEAFGRVTVEAIFNGCLVIGYNNAGTKEILAEKSLGLLYNTEEQLLNHLLDVSTKGINNYLPIIEKSQKEAIVLYTEEKYIQYVYDIYRDIEHKRIKSV